MNAGQIAILVVCLVLFIILLILVCNIRIIKQTDKAIVERLGAYHATWGVGIHFLIPFVDHISKVIRHHQG
jgi:regulator of protease activity HflC (stomatin/prohibitin superfamily)